MALHDLFHVAEGLLAAYLDRGVTGLGLLTERFVNSFWRLEELDAFEQRLCRQWDDARLLTLRCR